MNERMTRHTSQDSTRTAYEGTNTVYIAHLVAEAANLIQAEASKTGLQEAVEEFTRNSTLQDRVRDAVRGYEHLYAEHGILPHDIARAFCRPQIRTFRFQSEDTKPTVKRLAELTGSQLLLRILDGRDNEASIHVGVWHVSPNGKYAVLQHYHPEDIRNRGRSMKNCMEGPGGSYNTDHYDSMLHKTRTYGSLAEHRTPPSLLLTINRLTDTHKVSSETQGELDPEAFFTSIPLIMVEIQPARNAITQLRGVGDSRLGEYIFREFHDDPPENWREVGQCVKQLFRDNPFLKFADKIRNPKDKLQVNQIALTTGRIQKLLPHTKALDIPDPADVLYAGKMEVTSQMSNEYIDFVSQLFGAVLDCTRLTQEEKNRLSVVRGDIIDNSTRSMYPNLIHVRRLECSRERKLDDFAPLLAKTAYENGVKQILPDRVFDMSRLIPLEIAVEHSAVLDNRTEQPK